MLRLSIILAAPLILAACGSGVEHKKSGAAATGDTSVALPMGLPLMAGATVKANNTGAAGAAQTNAAATLITAEPVDAVVDYYTDALDDAGFGSLRKSEAGDIQALTAQREGEMGMVTVKPDGAKTMVMLVSRREP